MIIFRQMMFAIFNFKVGLLLIKDVSVAKSAVAQTTCRRARDLIHRVNNDRNVQTQRQIMMKHCSCRLCGLFVCSAIKISHRRFELACIWIWWFCQSLFIKVRSYSIPLFPLSLSRSNIMNLKVTSVCQ